MTNLTNAKIANTFRDLLQVNAATSNAGLDGTVRTIEDGGGTASPISMSTAQLDVTGQFALQGTVLTATANQLNSLALGAFTAFTAADTTLLLSEAGTSVSTASTSVTARVNPNLSVTNLFVTTNVSIGSAVNGNTASFTSIVSIGTLVASSIIYPVSDGTTGQVIITNGSGTLSFTDTSPGGGLFKGDNGTTGDASTGAGDIFRINEQELNVNVSITAAENASAVGPLSLASGVVLTVLGNLTII
tara:strand:- start:743 stop:1480 length:738 start_codon:yes stop_codon:yes gene_type:complete